MVKRGIQEVYKEGRYSIENKEGDKAMSKVLGGGAECVEEKVWAGRMGV